MKNVFIFSILLILSMSSFAQKAGILPFPDIFKYASDYGSSFCPTCLVDKEYTDSSAALRMKYSDSSAMLTPYFRLPGLWMIAAGHVIGIDTSAAGLSSKYIRLIDSGRYYYPYWSNPRGFLTGNQSITFTGDATGSGTTSIPLTLATVNSAPGSYGSSNQVPTLTINAKGLVTLVANTSIIFPVTSVFGRSGGAITMVSSDVTTALGFTPYNATNPNTYVNAAGAQAAISATSPISYASGIISHAASGVTAGSYNNVTVNSTGHVTSGSNSAYALSASPTLTGTVTLRDTTILGVKTVLVATDTIWSQASNGTRTALGTMTNSGVLTWLTNAINFNGGFVTNGSIKLNPSVPLGFVSPSGTSYSGFVPTPYGTWAAFPNGGGDPDVWDSAGNHWSPLLGSDFSPSVVFEGIDTASMTVGATSYVNRHVKTYTLANLPFAPKASPTFTGTPAAPTATSGTNTTQLATTAFVQSAISSAATTAVQLSPGSQQIGNINVSSVISGGNFFLPNSGFVGAAQVQSPYSITNILALDSHNHTLVGNGGVTLDSAGNATIPGNLSVGTLTIARKTVSIVYSFGAGTGATISVSGDGTSGRITLTTGTSPTAGNEVFALTLSAAYPNSSGMIIQGANTAAATLTAAQQLTSTSGGAGSNTSFVYSSGTLGLTAATTYVWMYVINGD